MKMNDFTWFYMILTLFVSPTKIFMFFTILVRNLSGPSQVCNMCTQCTHRSVVHLHICAHSYTNFTNFFTFSSKLVKIVVSVFEHVVGDMFSRGIVRKWHVHDSFHMSNYRFLINFWVKNGVWETCTLMCTSVHVLDWLTKLGTKIWWKVSSFWWHGFEKL